MRKLLHFALVCFLLGHSSDADAKRWIAVVAPDLREPLEPLEPLSKQRRAEGWDVTVLDATSDRAELIDRIAELAQEDKMCALVLMGDPAETATGTTLAAGKGTQARMAGKLSDLSWSAADGRLVKPIPTGRLPARSAEEADVMVRKILGWPERARSIGPFPYTRFIVGSHGMPPPFGAMADDQVNRFSLRLSRQLPARWRFEAMIHINGSPWQISSVDLATDSDAMMKSPSTILAYMGHAGRGGAESAKKALLTVNEWHALPASAPGIGLFFSCGCHTCDFDPGEEAFGFAAMRAAGGPAAVIGSQGETYAAMGYLALSGMLTRMGANSAPATIGDFWEGAREGLREGPIDEADFQLLDMADGSGGKLSLEAQRAEHLESWMLLGDPAMPLLSESPSIQLHASVSDSGNELEISGECPPSLLNARLRLTIERHPGNIRTDLPEVPPSGESRREATRKRRALSNDHVLATTELTAEGTAFKITVPLPTSLPSGPLVIRASALDRPPSAAGSLQIPGKAGDK